MATPQDHNTARLNILEAARNRGNQRHLDFVLPGLLAGTVGAVVSPGGAGKSMLALELCFAVAGGPDLLGLGIKPSGKAVYLAAEDPEDPLYNRLISIFERFPPDNDDDISERLDIQCLDGYGPDLGDENDYAYIRSACEDARLVVIDTLRTFHTMDENDNGEMSQLVKHLNKLASDTGASILFIHHSSKSAALNGGGGEQQASRGASVLVDNIRGGQRNLVGMTKEEADELGVERENRWRYVQLSSPKVNYDPKIDSHWLVRDSNGVLLYQEFAKGESTNDGKNGKPGSVKEAPYRKAKQGGECHDL